MYTNKNYEKLKQDLREVLDFEFPKLQQINELLQGIKIKRFDPKQCSTLATVATDGGDSKVSFEPLNIEVIRIADSKNNVHIEKFIPLSKQPQIFREMFETIPVLQNFLKTLDIKYEDVSDHLPTDINSNGLHDDNLQYAKVMREIIEWAVLLDLAQKESESNLILKDGLLRTVVLKSETLNKFQQELRKSYVKNKKLIVGVAKKSKVLNYISFSITIGNPFLMDGCCYCEVPKKLEKDSYNWHWINDNSFGDLHLVKLTKDPYGLIIPVDIPKYLQHEKLQILEYLAGVSQTTFPLPGYPEPLIKAHDNAVIKTIETEIISECIKEILKEKYEDPKERERFLRFLTLYKDYNINGGGYSGGTNRQKNRSF